ncbi:hypothetical protein, partial [Bradyrhizobium sp.]|uniref:hypothetical protein n=1 Tax=Bradyrhizobium sp. TaxID=376 RepID=UPI00291175B1
TDEDHRRPEIKDAGLDGRVHGKILQVMHVAAPSRTARTGPKPPPHPGRFIDRDAMLHPIPEREA